MLPNERGDSALTRTETRDYLAEYDHPHWAIELQRGMHESIVTTHHLTRHRTSQGQGLQL